MIKDNKIDGDWIKLFQTKITAVPGTPVNGRWMNIDLPVISAWVLTSPSGVQKPTTTARNPYYFKVDTEGNQLPYIDSIFFDYATDLNALALKAAAGEIDMMDRHINTNHNKPVFVDNMTKGNFSLFEEIPSSMNNMIISFNLTHKDKALRAVFQDINFRIGVSYAINRKELIDVVWVGQGEPYQCAPRPTSPYFNQTLAKQYTEFDVAKANAALDKALPKKGADGMRTLPDGKPLSIVWEISDTRADTVKAGPIVQKYLKAVGVDIQPKVEDRALMYTHKDANEFDGDGLGRRRRSGCDPRAALVLPLQRRVAVRRGLAVLVQQGSARRGTAGGCQETDGPVRPAQGHRRHQEAGRPDEADSWRSRRSSSTPSASRCPPTATAWSRTTSRT